MAVLLASAVAVYTSNVLAALRYLPLDRTMPGSPTFNPASLDSFSEVKLTEALQSVAASHMIIAVSRRRPPCPGFVWRAWIVVSTGAS